MLTMAISRMIFLLYLLIILISHTTAQPSFLYHFCMNDKGNYTANSVYQTNLNTVLSNLSSNTDINSGFYNFTEGQNSDKVNAIGLCRGDVKPDVCRSCLNDSKVLLTRRCPNQKEAIGWYDNCMLRYSNRSIFGVMDSEPTYLWWVTVNATDMDQFNTMLMDLVNDLRSKAASGGSVKKYAAGSAVGPSFQTIFALLQCTPDLSENQCSDCLVKAISNIPSCCAGKTNGKIGKPSCSLRFDTTLFYDSTADDAATPPPQSPSLVPPPPPPTVTNTTSTEGKSNTSKIVIAVAVPIVAIVVPTGAFVGFLIFICIYFIVRKPTKHIESEAKVVNENEQDSSQLDFDTIRVATNNFSDANKLGQGGFGPVYKGILFHEQEVAVKRLSTNSSQGEKEFKTEVLLMARLKHRNLVRLIGFSFERNERLLVYEFLPNKSLDKFLFDPFKRAQLDWKTRYKIIEGIARGLLYLHEDSQQRIIHRDLKASNILLDEEMKPKISDFGLAKLFDLDQTQAVTTKIAGTIGYMAPEYARHGKFSVKSDVFSYGVMILEIVSGKRNSAFCDGVNVEHLISYAWSNWKKGTISNLIDPTLNYGLRSEIERCIHIGLLCVQERVADRPTMASVVLMLDSNSFSLPGPLQPAFFMKGFRSPDIQDSSECSSMAMRYEHTSNSVEGSVNEASISSLYPR